MMKNKPIYCCFLILFCALKSLASDKEIAEVLFLQANEAVANKDYPKAIQRYKQLLSNGDQSANIHFNLGNVYFQSKQYGLASLHYEKALAIDPNDRDIQVNALISKKAAGIEIENHSSIDRFKYSLSVNSWFLLISITFWIIVCIFVINRFYKFRSIIIKLLTYPLLILLLIGFVAILLLHNESKRAIVTANESSMHLAPAQSSEITKRLIQSEEVSVIKMHNDYFLVENKKGARGWASKNDIQKIWD